MAFSSASGQAVYVDKPKDELGGWQAPGDDNPRQYVDYLPEPLYPGFIDPEAPTSEPDPGTGIVWVMSPEEDEISGSWGSVWRDAEKHTGCHAETRDEILAWALGRPATQWLARSNVGEPWVDLTGAPRPSPDTGTIWVSMSTDVGRSTGVGEWVAVWVAEGEKHATFRGSHEEVMMWALAQPARRRLISQREGEDWTELRQAM
jgi:hypothetical protein